MYVCAYTNIVTNIQRMWQGQVARISIQIDYIDDLDLQVGSQKKVDFPVLDAKSSTIFKKNDVPILNHHIFVDAHVEISGISHGISQLAMPAGRSWPRLVGGMIGFDHPQIFTKHCLIGFLRKQKKTGSRRKTWTQEVHA